MLDFKLEQSQDQSGLVSWFAHTKHSAWVIQYDITCPYNLYTAVGRYNSTKYRSKPTARIGKFPSLDAAKRACNQRVGH